MPHPRISALNVYPVKSCAGMGLTEARVGVRGLAVTTPAGHAGDREWMVVDPDGTFVTQREYPRLALVGTSVESGALVLTAAGKTPLPVSLDAHRIETREVVVWKSRVAAFDEGDAAARWLSSVLGADVRLVRFDPSHERLCNPVFAGDSGAHTAFADGYPVLVIGEASLAELNGRLAARGTPALPMNRFRPNIVLSGLEPFDEDHFDVLVASGVTMKLVKPCTRCRITTTDQRSAAVGAEPLETLGGYRMNERLGGVAFGMNAIVVGGAGRALSVGMDVGASFAF